jgi:hypothetical protein
MTKKATQATAESADVIVAGLDHDSSLQAILRIVRAGGATLVGYESRRRECAERAAEVAVVNAGQVVLQREKEGARRAAQEVRNKVAQNYGGRVSEAVAREEADASRRLSGIEEKFEAGRAALEAAGADLEKARKAACRVVLDSAVRYAHRQGVAAAEMVAADIRFLTERPGFTPEAFLQIHAGIVALAELARRIVVVGQGEIMAAFGGGLGKDGLAVLDGALESRPLYRASA